MKSLLLKDLYNIGHNMRSMFVTLIFLSLIQLPSVGPSAYLAVCAVLGSSMILTTFHFDEQCNWNRWAMVMPLNRRDVIRAKFAALAIFGMGGILWGLMVGAVGSLFPKVEAVPVAEFLLVALSSLGVVLLVGSTLIPLVIRFGAEKSRIMMILTYLVPAGLIYGAWKLAELLGFRVDELNGLLLTAILVLAGLGWCFGMYCISCRIFDKMEL